MHNKIKTTLSRLPAWFAAILPPWVFLLYLYRQNTQYLLYGQVIGIAFCLTLGAITLQFFASLAFRSSQLGALVSDLLWILFFTVKEWYYYWALQYLHRYIVVSILMLIVLICIVIIVKFRKMFQRREVTLVVVVFWIVVFMLNFVPVTYAQIQKTSSPGTETVKTSFAVDDAKPSPDIYWLFVDGMMGFKAYDYLFHDPQDQFVDSLKQRGFLINYDAQFEAFHRTTIATPSLMSPHWYDAVMLPLLEIADLSHYDSKMEFIQERINKAVLSDKEARQKNELIAAFIAKGYEVNIITFPYNIFYPTCNRFYVNGRLMTNTISSDKYDGLIKWYELQGLLNTTSLLFTRPLYYITTPVYSKISEILFGTSFDLSLNTYEKPYNSKVQVDEPLRELLKMPLVPCLTIVYDMTAHYPFIYNEDGSIRADAAEDMDASNYRPQHRLAARNVLEYIDLITARDPDAVIILQSDHGLHYAETRNLLLSSGRTDEDVRLIQNSTISAVRIPEKWGGLDAPLEPLNISRFLVNKFVGENYRLLDSEEIIR